MYMSVSNKHYAYSYIHTAPLLPFHITLKAKRGGRGEMSLYAKSDLENIQCLKWHKQMKNS